MIIKTIFSNYEETASAKKRLQKLFFVFTNQILRPTTSEKVSSVHPFVKKNVIYYTFSYEKMQFLTFFLMNIMCVHFSIVQLHFKHKIRSSFRRSLIIFHLLLSCVAARLTAATKQQHCRLHRYPGSANKQRHRYRTCNQAISPPAGRLPNRPACCTKM